MSIITKYPEPLVFGLDIGTRSIVGIVGYKKLDKFNVIAMSIKYHDTRAMLDGQIHDINAVGQEIKYIKEDLERQLGGRKLTDVSIAAAGRVLKTAVGVGNYEFSENTTINMEYIHSIDLIGVENAHSIILEQLKEVEDNTKFYCVGYTVIKYYLNDFEITNLEGHKGKKIGSKVLATFLPEEVVDSLYTAVELSGLSVSCLTLEPIAAINVAIPEQYRLLNIALIDVGAGTSDICITKDGSIIGYGMIPAAGDELTEALQKKYLVDFKTAENLKMSASKKRVVTYKDIMGIAYKISPTDLMKTISHIKEEITRNIAEKIIQLNGGMTVSAAFVVGGGGKLAGFTESLASYLKLPTERVALRGAEVMNNIEFLIEEYKKDSLFVTPVGICMNYFDQKNNFIFVTVNNSRIKLYNNAKLTIFDAALQYGIPNEHIFAKRGADLTFKVNGKTRIVRGQKGEAAVIKQNGKIVGMNALIEANDKIEILESTAGENAKMELGGLPEYESKLNFIINEKSVICPKFAMVNNKLESQFYLINNNDEIIMRNYYILSELLTFIDYIPEGQVFVNNQLADSDTKVYENFLVNWKDNIEFKDLKVDNEIIKEVDDDYEFEKTTNIKDDHFNNTNDVSSKSMDKLIINKVEDKTKTIKVLVNNKVVMLSGKEKYCFVDVFDFYDFDLKVVAGTKLVTEVNGHEASHFEPIEEGSVIEIYWKG